jgi:hypothetical protein
MTLYLFFGLILDLALALAVGDKPTPPHHLAHRSPSTQGSLDKKFPGS